MNEAKVLIYLSLRPVLHLKSGLMDVGRELAVRLADAFHLRLMSLCLLLLRLHLPRRVASSFGM